MADTTEIAISMLIMGSALSMLLMGLLISYYGSMPLCKLNPKGETNARVGRSNTQLPTTAGWWAAGRYRSRDRVFSLKIT